jgi:hypothetical protein
LTLGIDEDQVRNGFTGAIRNVRLFDSVYMDDAQAYRVQFSYLLPTRTLKLSLLYDLQTSGLANEAGAANGIIVGDPKNVWARDSLGSVICSNQGTSSYQSYFREAANFT